MGPTTACAATAHDAAPFDEHDLNVLRLRVSREFREIPGLLLTVPQAARLFSLDAARCERVLRTLVDRGVLVTDGRAFGRAVPS